jgi:hypothetical protein
MYRVLVEGKALPIYQGFDPAEAIAFVHYRIACEQSRADINHDFYGCDVFIYHNEYCIRQYVGHIQEPYNYPHTD